uniref:C-type lectin domain-containing protein n=1 Tax=Panagrolaimus sp. PS1159 TaxID=55785 RepID=A0AC35FYS2_9BILA
MVYFVTICLIFFVFSTPTYLAHNYPASHVCKYVGWSYYPPTGACYGVGVQPTKGSWSDAEKYCQGFDANLASIHSAEELRHIISYVCVAWNNTWTGIYKKNGIWEASDATEADFIKYGRWCKGHPTEYNDERCVGIGYDGNDPCYFDANCFGDEMITFCKKQMF